MLTRQLVPYSRTLLSVVTVTSLGDSDYSGVSFVECQTDAMGFSAIFSGCLAKCLKHRYEARYHQIAGCIFPMGDITRLIPDEEADVCIMEEPEHLNWFRATGANWSKKFTHVVGVIHTNYIHYTMADKGHWASGRVKAPFARAFNKIMARAYCDKVSVYRSCLGRGCSADASFFVSCFRGRHRSTLGSRHSYKVRLKMFAPGGTRRKLKARGRPSTYKRD